MLLVPAFFVTAMLYAAAGFGGGSTYNALLVLAAVDYRILPVVALLCNLIVVTGGAIRFAQAGYIDWRRAVPWITTSVPAAWLGGRMPVSEAIFTGILGFALLAASLYLLLPGKKSSIEARRTPPDRVLSYAAGAGLGFLAGITGIGGGIYLAPVLHFMKWGTAKQIAGMCSFFILVNSLAGLAGQLQKSGLVLVGDALSAYWILFPAVLIGGQIGSYMGAVRLRHDVVKFLTGILVLYVAARLLWRWWGL